MRGASGASVLLLSAAFLILISCTNGAKDEATRKPCSCKCVTKDENGKFTNTYGKGADREAAGIDLKKNLAGGKCELTPVCEGSCAVQ